MGLAQDSKGIAVHFNGDKGRHEFGLLDCDGYACEEVWAGIRRYHMEEKGWRDIAYSWGACPGCGRQLTGRDWGNRTAANGTNYGNNYYHAVMVLIGGNERLTDKAKITVLDLGYKHRQEYGRMKLVEHGDLAKRVCPGPIIGGWLDDGAPDPRDKKRLRLPTEEEMILHFESNGHRWALYEGSGQRIRLGSEADNQLNELRNESFVKWLGERPDLEQVGVD